MWSMLLDILFIRFTPYNCFQINFTYLLLHFCIETMERRIERDEHETGGCWVLVHATTDYVNEIGSLLFRFFPSLRLQNYT